MTDEEISELLATSLAENEENHLGQMPYRSDGSEYKTEDLHDDQKEALALVLNSVRCYCAGIQVNVEKILRLTVSGVAGSGKSTWINTLVTVLCKLFPQDETVAVFAPTGTAAFNAGGQTIHRGFSIGKKLTLELSSSSQKYLLSRFARTLVIIIDERSMIDASILGLIKHYAQQSAHSGRNKKEAWGGIPIVILVGDDYQLPPIMPGAFYALSPETQRQMKKRN
jgi:hypothetical protein